MCISPLYSTVFTHSVFPSKLTTTYSCKLLNVSSPELLIFLKCLSFPWKKKKKSSIFMARFRWCFFQEAFSDFSRSDVIFSIKSHCGICTPPPSLVIFFACLVYIQLCLYHLDFGEGSGTSLFLPGESHGQRSLVGYSPSGC
ncbi:unnamed protein product [Rangifer tarandus platyrhynchus]|uniref:Uncharacterized protein n=2 Tax=Rangifer tarandus platyrhynchus TaxID=3082113 RepID=A0ABN8Z183_RANTA|nr:unnamed protein product [Rangifer tarandus platyrhynchus]